MEQLLNSLERPRLSKNAMSAAPILSAGRTAFFKNQSSEFSKFGLSRPRQSPSRGRVTKVTLCLLPSSCGTTNENTPPLSLGTGLRAEATDFT